jgi:uncharacterized protein (DUF2249 family)/hemerythrin-like domain-containing protein
MRKAVQEIDLRRISADQHIPRALAGFDALRADQGVLLVSDHPPRAVLAHLQEERAGRFEWNVLESGPATYRIEVLRRPVEGPRQVRECLGEDHRRLDGILGEVERLVSARAFDEAGRRMSEFSCGLNRHIEIEERIMFPEFEDVTGGEFGPTNMMRAEHVEIRRFMAQAETAVQAGDGNVFARAVAGLRQVLGEHNLKEERVLYPMVDGGAGSEHQRDLLVRRMQAF